MLFGGVGVLFGVGCGWVGVVLLFWWDWFSVVLWVVCSSSIVFCYCSFSVLFVTLSLCFRLPLFLLLSPLKVSWWIQVVFCDLEKLVKVSRNVLRNTWKNPERFPKCPGKC